MLRNILVTNGLIIEFLQVPFELRLKVGDLFNSDPELNPGPWCVVKAFDDGKEATHIEGLIKLIGIDGVENLFKAQLPDYSSLETDEDRRRARTT